MRNLRCIVTSLMLVLGLYTAALAASAPGTPMPPLVIDTRSEAEWNSGHVEGALLIPHDKIAEGITKATSDKNSRILLYCRTGNRSGKALETLRKAGYNNVSNLGTLENASRTLNKPIVK